MSIIEKTIGTKTHRGLVALVLTICYCGSGKKKRISFCPSCYCRLPLEMKRALYRRAGQGCEEAYDAAAAHLSKR